MSSSRYIREILGSRDGRTICDVIYEIQEFDKQKTYSLLLLQLEEIRLYAQRMEDKLWKYRQVLNGDEDDYEKRLKEERQKLKDEIFELRSIKYQLNKEGINVKKETEKTEAQTTPKT